jgi:hypothetical protein
MSRRTLAMTFPGVPGGSVAADPACRAEFPQRRLEPLHGQRVIRGRAVWPLGERVRLTACLVRQPVVPCSL